MTAIAQPLPALSFHRAPSTALADARNVGRSYDRGRGNNRRAPCGNMHLVRRRPHRADWPLG